MPITELYTGSVVLSGGVDLLAPPDQNRVALRIYSFDPFIADCGLAGELAKKAPMFRLAFNTPLDLLFSRLGPFVQCDFYVQGTPGRLINFVSIDV